MKKPKIFYYIIIILIMIIIGIFLIGYGLMLENSIVPIYNYKVEKSSDYEVVLKPNDFYLENVLPANRYYVANSIDLYKINFKYLFKGDKNLNIDYNYNITANLIGIVEEDGDEKEVWNREFNLSNIIKETINQTDQFEIDEKIDVDYEYYNNLARLFENEYGIKIQSVLKVYFNISYVTDLEKENDPIKDDIELEIPITNKLSEVKENYDKENVKQIVSEKDNLKLYKKIFVIISGIFIICSAVLIIVIKLKNKKTPDEEYSQKLNQILKYYKDIIITVEDMPDLKDLKVINVSYIEDLIDIAEQTKTNIIYNKTEKTNESLFYIITDNYKYVYNLKINR